MIFPPCRHHRKLSTTNVPAEELALAARRLRITIPPSARAEGLYVSDGWLDPVTYLRIQLPSSDAETMLSSSPFAGWTWGLRERDPQAQLSDWLSQRLPWWDCDKLAP